MLLSKPVERLDLPECEPGTALVNKDALDLKFLRTIHLAAELSFHSPRYKSTYDDEIGRIQDKDYIKHGSGSVPGFIEPLVSLLYPEFPEAATPSIATLRFRRRIQVSAHKGLHQDIGPNNYRLIVPFVDCNLTTESPTSRGRAQTVDIHVGDVVALNNGIEGSHRLFHALTPLETRADVLVLGRTLPETE